jgi:hypothetical protein
MVDLDDKTYNSLQEEIIDLTRGHFSNPGNHGVLAHRT